MSLKHEIEQPRQARAVVLISGGGSNLQAFIDQIAAGHLDLKIELVISNNAGVFGLKRANEAAIQSLVVDHTEYDSRLEFDHELMQAIDSAQPDLVILAGFMRILTAEFVQHYSNRLINIHPSLLPKYPGNNTHARVLDNGDEWHGASIHFVVPEVDAGPIILQGRMPVHENDTPESLQNRIHKIEHQLYPKAAQWFSQNRLSIKSGQVLLDGETSVEQLQTFDL